MNDISIEQIRPELTWRLRQQVLYPNQTLEEMEMDEDNYGYHFAAFTENKLVAVVSLFKRGDNFQFRKFAVEPSFQNKGIGSALLQYITNFAINEDARRIWCNARLNAIPFYLKHAFVQTGEHFSKNGFSYEIVEKSLNQKVVGEASMKTFRFLVRLVFGVEIGLYGLEIIFMRFSRSAMALAGYSSLMLLVFVLAPLTLIFIFVVIYHCLIKRNSFSVFKKEFIYISIFLGMIVLLAVFFSLCPTCEG